ncbi:MULTISPECIES: hypothetical protein [Mesorhizobium]|uniref:Uncharacterized protein n=1 Tax=Mesorhizobium shonense TaxID=1209948 RepID=A0ABV2HZU6_9HYPH|nr:hypothetical protein [Mesorhizobium sp.]RWB21963.1 MAG: hypothetical protein EOQ40_08585 [Mesorhizobium sp.]RWE02310.1 MAG: hypothetical protein EOS40_08055 [Mesorhizobium sp.]TIS48660.1 MAG: hypothetical protein E5W96_16675 [Mesorhizobium sp.]
MGRKSNLRSWLLRISVAAVILCGAGSVAGKPVTTLGALNFGALNFGAMNSGEVSTLHTALFIATVWIVSSLRVNRLRALWRVGFRLMRTRGPSGYLLPRGPKARAAAGGSVSGAGASGVS